MSVRLSLVLAVILMFVVVGFGFDNARARKIEANMNSHLRLNNEPATGQRYYYRRHRRHHHHHHHRRYRHYRYSYYRR